jgi:Xaa-Pro dipeptidase
MEGAGPAPDDTYPRFSERELSARRAALVAAMGELGVEHAVVYGANRAGTAVGWLTGWPVTREALLVLTPGERDVLFIEYFNHVPNATRMAVGAEVRSADPSADVAAVEELRRRGAAGRRVGVMGPIGYRGYGRLAGLAGEVVDLDGVYGRLRMRKSEEELAWVRMGAALTDRAVRALRDGARPGLEEAELIDLVERSYVPAGGTTHIHFLSATPMAQPERCVPAQWPSRRRLATGDVLVCELSAAYWEYPGQALRTFTVAAEPAPLFEELHAVAEAAFDAVVGRLRAGATAAQLVEAASLIDEAGYTVCDDLVHGFVGGYFPPILRTPGSAREPVPDFMYEAGMTVVVQPNVITKDRRAGVQVGELLLVTESGVERLHDLERGLLRIGDVGAR